MVLLVIFNFDTNNLRPSFTHPVTGKQVYVFLDISHMLKLVRNTFATQGVLFDNDDNTIDWSYIAKLENEQAKEGILLANKLKKQHVDFYNQKMKTSLV